MVEFEEVTPDGTGEIVAHTVIEGAAPPEFATFEKQHGPIGVVVVELDEGVRVPAMLADCNPRDCGRGDRVQKVVRRIYEQEGVIRYGFKFTPTDD
ncbi:Zn-ribbon domain-containing OB-fold protein [Halorubrum sp. HHNYT27]|uniref:Zn-ribbon domain-containing OB-fold protein n=1 Tax=Halorubrum sp. HHNYT27 TaxID=3402275 RepID=UPI003EBFE426